VGRYGTRRKGRREETKEKSNMSVRFTVHFHSTIKQFDLRSSSHMYIWCASAIYCHMVIFMRFVFFGCCFEAKDLYKKKEGYVL